MRNEAIKKIALIVAMLAAVSCSAQAGAGAGGAQQAPTPAIGVAGEVKAAWGNIKTNVTKMADRMPEADYAFKASPEIRTFGELMQHIADSQVFYCSTAAGEMKRPEPATKTAKADVVAAMKASIDTCDAVFDKLTDASAMENVRRGRAMVSRLSVLWGNITHSNEEYGYGSIYLRLKGLTPPSSDNAKK